MKSTFRGALVIAAGLLVAAVAAKPAVAQWSASTYGVAEYDTDQTLLLLAGLTAGPGGMGVQPRIGVQAYHLSFDAGTDRTSVVSVKPFVGLVNNYNDGSVSGSVGYAFTNKDIPFSPAATSDQGEGVVVSGGWETYGLTTPLAWQALASYNFGSSALWARGRATGKVSDSGTRSTRLGGEVAFLNGDNYRIIQPGAVLEFHNGSSVVGLGAGMKFFEGGDSNVYFKVEGSLPLGR